MNSRKLSGETRKGILQAYCVIDIKKCPLTALSCVSFYVADRQDLQESDKVDVLQEPIVEALKVWNTILDFLAKL